MAGASRLRDALWASGDLPAGAIKERFDVNFKTQGGRCAGRKPLPELEVVSGILYD
ncbi:hypothetical protein [Streptomyces sp. NPDC058572]|uniref:hypothetical protein n=1 Tax=Streptomyces sp. NPDC058572 TaxID=3346546 RepID=UPI00366A0F09